MWTEWMCVWGGGGGRGAPRLSEAQKFPQSCLGNGSNRHLIDDDPLSFCSSHIAARLIFDDDPLSFSSSHIAARLIFDDGPLSFYSSHIASRLIFGR